ATDRASTTDAAAARSTTRSRAAHSTSADADTSHAAAPQPPPPPAQGTPGRLVLQNLPQGARISIDGQQVRGNQLDLPPGGRHLTVRATGYQTYDRQVIITAGETHSMRVDMQTSEDAGGPCDQYGPAYNQDNLCFD